MVSEENDNYRIRPSTSNQSKFKLDEREFNEMEIESEENVDNSILSNSSDLEKINELASDNIDPTKFHDAIDNEDELFLPIEQIVT